jgi:hypothetical protein
VGAAQFGAKLDLLLERDHRNWLQRVDAYLQDMSWDRTWSEMNTLIESVTRIAERRAEDTCVGAEDGRSLLAGAAYV